MCDLVFLLIQFDGNSFPHVQFWIVKLYLAGLYLWELSQVWIKVAFALSSVPVSQVTFRLIFSLGFPDRSSINLSLKSI